MSPLADVTGIVVLNRSDRLVDERKRDFGRDRLSDAAIASDAAPAI
jgi:hypothetical protein